MISSFKAAVHGFVTTWREERNFKIEVLIGTLVLLSRIWIPFTFPEYGLLIGAVCAVLTAELVNTAIEDLCDKVEPEFDSSIGKVKDIMAAYVLVSCTGAMIVGISVFITHFV